MDIWGVDFVVKVLEHRACTVRYLSIETDTDDESMLSAEFIRIRIDR